MEMRVRAAMLCLALLAAACAAPRPPAAEGPAIHLAGTEWRRVDDQMQAAAERSFLAVLRATRYGHYDQHALVLLDEEQHQLARFDSMQ
jgi:hypothetical protein